MKKSGQKRKQKKVVLMATLATAAIIVGGMTFAWFTSTDEVTNRFETAGGLKTVIVENFVPPTNWAPGEETDKVVQVVNTGSVPAYTRVKLQEKLVKTVKATEGTKIDDSTSLANNAAAYKVDGSAIDLAVKNWNDTTANATHTADKDGTYFVIINGKVYTPDFDASGNLKAATDLTEYTTDGALKTQLAAFVANTPKNANLKIYVKASTTTSGGGDETGYNYDFMSYYEAPAASDGTRVSYEVDVFQVDEKDVKTKANNVVTHDYSTTKFEYDYYTTTETVITDADALKKLVVINFADNAGWYYNNDGYFYYKIAIASGESTTPLIKSVTLTGNAEDDMANATYLLKVVEDSVQTDSGVADSAWNVTWSTISAATGNVQNKSSENGDGTTATTEVAITRKAAGVDNKIDGVVVDFGNTSGAIGTDSINLKTE